MSHRLRQRELIICAATGDFEIRRIVDDRIIGPVDHGWIRYREDPDSFC
ncbi:MAG: hypothetical protein GQ526_10840, partial [Ardenticatenales bacterium]|nr:hypothetical protein [Ardenticatenales bacterium]